MRRLRYALIGAATVVGIAVFGFAAWIYLLKGNSYDAPVREVSMKIDSLARDELSDSTTIAALQRKLSQFIVELESTSTKLPSGNSDDTATVQDYFRSALDYLKAKDRWLSSLAERSHLMDQMKDPAAFTKRCMQLTDPMSMSSCMLEASSEAKEVISRFEQSNQAYAKTVDAEHATMVLFVDAREKVYAVVTKQGSVPMPDFEKLLISKAK